jgi:hypothetical protein
VPVPHVSSRILPGVNIVAENNPRHCHGYRGWNYYLLIQNGDLSLVLCLGPIPKQDEGLLRGNTHHHDWGYHGILIVQLDAAASNSQDCLRDGRFLFVLSLLTIMWLDAK